MPNNIIEETTDRIQKLVDFKSEQIRKIDEMIGEAREKKGAADEAISRAIEETDINAYSAAKKEQADAASTIEMYMARRDQLINKKYVDEESSNATIKALADYQTERAQIFTKALSEKVKELNVLYDEYIRDNNSALQTAADWTQRIHPYYINPNRTYKDGSNRSETPVSVSLVMHKPCEESHALRTFLDSYKRVSRDTQ